MIWCACIVLHHNGNVLLIADKTLDLSFPGGKKESTDKGPKETAVREFCEEVFGLDQKATRLMVYQCCSTEIITKLRDKLYTTVMLRGRSIKGCKKKRISKDTIYYCIHISAWLYNQLVANHKMVPLPINSLEGLTMRRRENSSVKKNITLSISGHTS
jgi:hypothetical protein